MDFAIVLNEIAPLPAWPHPVYNEGFPILPRFSTSMSGVGILCFTASYAVALCLEISRIFFRGPIRGVLTLVWLLAGLVAHTAYLYYNHAASPVPIDGPESYFLVSAWGVILVYLYLLCFHPKIPFGFVLLPIVLLLIGGAVLIPPESAASESPTTGSLWKRFHAGTFFLATLSVCVGFAAGLLYFIQDRRLRQKRPPTRFLKLPTLEWSLSVCRQAIGASMFLLGACIFSGFLLRSTGSKPLSTADPLVWGTLLLFVFLLLFSGVLSSRFFKTEGRYVAALTLVAFLFLVSILLFGVLLGNAHWKRGNGGGWTVGGDASGIRLLSPSTHHLPPATSHLQKEVDR